MIEFGYYGNAEHLFASNLVNVNIDNVPTCDNIIISIYMMIISILYICLLVSI